MHVLATIAWGFWLPSWVLLLQVHDTAQAPSNVECVQEVEIPRFAALARLAVRTGTVIAWMSVGDDGKLAKIHTEAPDRWLGEEVKAWMEHTARFWPACKGREVRLLFTFELEGKPRDHPFVITRFRPPNHFVIVSQPGKPHIYVDPRGAPPDVPPPPRDLSPK